MIPSAGLATVMLITLELLALNELIQRFPSILNNAIKFGIVMGVAALSIVPLVAGSFYFSWWFFEDRYLEE